MGTLTLQARHGALWRYQVVCPASTAGARAGRKRPLVMVTSTPVRFASSQTLAEELHLVMGKLRAARKQYDRKDNSPRTRMRNDAVRPGVAAAAQRSWEQIFSEPTSQGVP